MCLINDLWRINPITKPLIVIFAMTAMSVSIIGCGLPMRWSSNPKYESAGYVPPGYGTVYIFRRNDMVYGGRWLEKVPVTIDGEWTTSVGHGGYFPYQAKTGEHEIRLSSFPFLWYTDSITLDIEDQKSYFIGIVPIRGSYEFVPSSDEEQIRSSILQ